MTGQQYETMVKPFRKHPNWIPLLIWCNKIITLSGYLIYPLILIFLFLIKSSLFVFYLLIPAAGFAGISIFRKIYNKPRPYENPELITLTKREKNGQSFPSRHLFSYSLISVLLWSLFPLAGIVLLVLTFLLAYLRVILGVHYPIDVIMGIIFGIVFGLLTILLCMLII